MNMTLLIIMRVVVMTLLIIMRVVVMTLFLKTIFL